MADTPQTQDPMLSSYLSSSSQQTGVELQHQKERQTEMAPVLEAEQKALAQPSPTPPQPVQMPQAPKGPIVDAHDFQKFSMGMVALSLIAGGLSKTHWMNAASSLDGAMKGYLQGSMELAKQKRDDFEREFKLAVEKETQQTKEYTNAINARDRSIKDILAQAEVIAQKYNMVDAQDAIRRRDLDGMFKAVTTRTDSLNRMQMMKQKMDDDVKNKRVAQWDRLLQSGQITPQQHDDAVNAINAGDDPGQVHTSGGMSEQDLGIAIQSYLQTGKMPSLGMRNNAIRNQIISGADKEMKAMGLTPADVVAAWGTRTADISALTQVTRQQAAVVGYEETARKNMQLALDASNSVPRTQFSQFINKWLQFGRVQTGDANADRFNAAVETFVSEYAKVMGGGYGAGGSTEGAQSRAHQLLSTATTPEQFKAVTDQMGKEMTNRTQAIEEQKQKLITDIKGGHSKAGTVLKFDAQGNPVQ